MKPNIVFNSHIDLFSKRYIEKTSPFPRTPEFLAENQRQKMLALLAEQFLLFDSVAIKTDRSNYPLLFLIGELGINRVEELFRNGSLKLVLWTPVIATSVGTQLPNGKTDESTVLGSPPIFTGMYVEEDSDPEKNLDNILNRFQIHEDRKKIFKKVAIQQYVLPDNSVAEKAKEIILDAYAKNRLLSFGFDSRKDATQLNSQERIRLLKLGDEILETSVIAEKEMKSYDNYAYFHLTKDSVKHIESALRVSENTSKIFQVQNIPDIQALFHNKSLSLDNIFELRDKSVTAKYREWINSISTDINANQISKEYVSEITGKNNFFDSNKGKFLRTVGMFGIGSGVSAMLGGGIPGLTLGTVAGKAADLGFSLIDTYIVDGLLKGWNPKMFIDEINDKLDK